MEPLEKRVEAILADDRRGSIELKLEGVRAVFAEVIRRDTLYANVLSKIKGVYEQRIRAAVREVQEGKSRTSCGPLAEEVDALKGKLYRSEVEKTQLIKEGKKILQQLEQQESLVANQDAVI